MSETLLLIDGFGYLYRAHHATGDLRTSDGRPTGAIFGALNMLDKLRRRYPPSRVACVMDAPGKTFRHDIDPNYKATRPPMPDDLRSQLSPFGEFVAALGWPMVSVANVEADDVIASLAKKGAAAGMTVVIASTDKDLFQLAGGQISLYDGMKDRVFDAAATEEKFGVAPARIGDYLALLGDASDNIPGVPKVGAKTAAKWLNEYGDLDNIVARKDEFGGKVGDSLRAAIADGVLQRARRLVALKDDLPQTLDELAPTAPNVAAWRRLCEEWEFRRLGQALDDAPSPLSSLSHSPSPLSPPAQRVTDIASLTAWADKIRAAGAFAVDTETIGEPVMVAELVGFSLAVEGESAYVPLAHRQESPPQLSRADALRVISPLLQDPNIVKVLHNGKYDWHVFANHGVELGGILEDTKIAAYVANPGANNTLSGLAAAELRARMASYRDLVDGKTVKDFADVDIDKAADYAAADAEMTWRLRARIIAPLSAAKARLYAEIERPLMPVLAEIERVGMKIDVAALHDFAKTTRARMAALEERAEDIAGADFNLNSPRQLEKALFDELGAKPLRKTGGGARSTDERTLERLAPDYELAQIALEHRGLAKLVGTYAEKLPRMATAGGRVHTNFSQTAVVTGRLSSASPNLQQIPHRTEEGRRIRRAFVAEEGFCLLSADYSQIELRLVAHIAGDDALLAAFAAGADIHRQTAAEVFGAPLEDVTSAQRGAAKAINFGLIYGMSAFGLARRIGATQAEAQRYIDLYFGRYPEVAEFMRRTRREAPERGHVETIFGRRIPLAMPRGGRPALERFAINAPIQGSAADLVKKAMLVVAERLRAGKMRSRIILQVHDELVLEADLAEADDLRAALPGWMNVADLSAPLTVDVRRGENWDEAG